MREHGCVSTGAWCHQTTAVLVSMVIMNKINSRHRYRHRHSRTLPHPGKTPRAVIPPVSPCTIVSSQALHTCFEILKFQISKWALGGVGLRFGIV